MDKANPLWACYRHWRQLGHKADSALIMAGYDISAGRTRYIDSFVGVPGWWQTPRTDDSRLSRQSQRLMALQDDTGGGAFRTVGEVVPESYGGRGHVASHWKHRAYYRSTREHTGWYTRHDGTTMRDGDGLCWGVVLQLPGRKGISRFVAGYQFGGCDGGPVVDLGRIFADTDQGDAADHEGASEAARYADEMAKEAAEEEREHNTAWTAGSDWAELQDEIEGWRTERRNLVREIRAACHLAGNGLTAIRAALAHRVAELRELSREAHDKQKNLAAGNYDDLYFYPDKRLAASFNEGARRRVLSTD